jgi:FtsH ternary system domain X6
MEETETHEPDPGMTVSPTTPKSVSRFEANLLRILRFLLKQAPPEQAMPLVQVRMERPACLSRNAIDLAKDHLSKGIVLHLVRAGGWKRDRFLRDGQPKFGRLWERTDVAGLGLSFSKHALDWLIWLTAVRLKEEKVAWRGDPRQFTLGDQVMLFLSYDALRKDRDTAATLRESPAFRTNGLIWLFFATDFADDKDPTPPGFDLWLSGPGSLVLEALQPALEARWIRVERNKGQISDWNAMRLEGAVQIRVAEAFLAGAERLGRRDCTRFLLSVLSRLLATAEMPSTFWTGGLAGAGPPRLSERTETQRNALAVLRQVGTFREWQQRSRQVGYMDDDYNAARFWLGECERYNFHAVAERAERVLVQVEPLRLG